MVKINLVFFSIFQQNFEIGLRIHGLETEPPAGSNFEKLRKILGIQPQTFYCNFIRGHTVITKLNTSRILDFVNTKHPDYHSRTI